MLTNELTNDNLGYVVALIEYPEWKEQGYLESVRDLYFDDGDHYAPWKNWAQGGPIIERESIRVTPDQGETYVNCVWFAGSANGDGDEFNGEGPTPLIAAMRCYIASKLGDQVEVPDELQ